jgi:hypothetical protein
MTWFLFLRTLSVITFSTRYGVHLPIPEPTRSIRVMALANAIQGGLNGPYFAANHWIWDVEGEAHVG